MCLAQGHNAVTPVRLEPAALRSRVKHSTTEPLRLSVRTNVYLCVIVCPSVCLCSLSDYLNRNQRSSLQIYTPKITSKFHSKNLSKIPLHKPLHSMAPLHSSTPLQVLAYARHLWGNYAVLYTEIKEIVKGKTQQSM